MWFGGEEVHGVDVDLRLPPVLDALDVWMRQKGAYNGDNGSVLVMFRSRISSSLATLSINLRLSSSTIMTFHCGESA